MTLSGTDLLSRLNAMTRIISRGETYGASLSTTTSVAVFEGAQIKIFGLNGDPFA